jgi:hypothetical protein
MFTLADPSSTLLLVENSRELKLTDGMAKKVYKCGLEKQKLNHTPPPHPLLTGGFLEICDSGVQYLV